MHCASLKACLPFEIAPVGNPFQIRQQVIHLPFLHELTRHGGRFRRHGRAGDDGSQFGPVRIAQRRSRRLADVGDESGEARAIAVVASDIGEPFQRLGGMADGLAVAVKPTEVSRVLIHRPARLQIAQADEIMNLFLLQLCVDEQIERFGDHARRFQTNEQLRQLAVERPALRGELAVELFDGELDQVVSRRALPGEAHLNDAQLFELLFFVERVEREFANCFEKVGLGLFCSETRQRE